MKVHFACSTSQLDVYKNDYRNICRLLKGMGHTITLDWLEQAVDFFEKKSPHRLNHEGIYNKVTASILASDVVIVEGTVMSFSVGHQLTLGLSKNKPCLFLVKKRSKSSKNIKAGVGSFLDGITTPLLTVAEYDDANLPDILDNFFNSNSGKPIVKFNIVLTKEIDNYLDWASFTYKVNKSEYIRNLILKEMRGENQQFKK